MNHGIDYEKLDEIEESVTEFLTVPYGHKESDDNEYVLKLNYDEIFIIRHLIYEKINNGDEIQLIKIVLGILDKIEEELSDKKRCI